MNPQKDQYVGGLAPEGSPWWEREGLGYRAGKLHIEGQNVTALAASMGTPLYLYSLPRIEANLQRLREAIRDQALPIRLFYAMKSNRYPPLLSHLASLGACGIDACSPEEVLLARQVGFREDAISFTGTSVSDADLTQLARFQNLWINVDAVSTMRRLARISPGREIGIRINPGVGLGYRSNDRLQYAGNRPTKFGIYEADFPAALAEARTLGLHVRGLHLHAGCGYLSSELGAWERILERYRAFLKMAPEIRHVNLGGGLGIPLVQDDAPLDLSAWSALVASALGDLDVEIWMEPGDYLVKDAGVLVLEVNTVETKAGVRFVGVNGGFNLHPEPVFYDLPLEIVPVDQPDPSAASSLEPVTVVGNINEALDVWARDIPLPPVAEGHHLAFLNAGGYGASMSSNHCMRGHFREAVLRG